MTKVDAIELNPGNGDVHLYQSQYGLLVYFNSKHGVKWSNSKDDHWAIAIDTATGEYKGCPVEYIDTIYSIIYIGAAHEAVTFDRIIRCTNY